LVVARDVMILNYMLWIIEKSGFYQYRGFVDKDELAGGFEGES